MSAQYDGIAAQYVQARQSPLHEWVEKPSFMSLAGDVRGLRVLDLACGDGRYTRALRGAGAGEVVGVDVSPAMIALARQADGAAGISYYCADAADLPPLGQFDLVTAAYLLHYAGDREELSAMCRNIARALRPGCRFVALNENPACPAEPGGSYVPYGFTKTMEGPPVDGTPIRYRMFAGRDSFTFEARYFSRETYENALRAAGFVSIAWHPLAPDAAGLDAMGAGYFAAYLAAPPVIGLSCQLGA